MKMMTSTQLSQFSPYNIASNPALSVNYIFTPKNACSSIKASIFGMEPAIDFNHANGQIHFNQWHGNFSRHYCFNEIDVNKPFFCVTRNPYSRVVSAFLDKIGKEGDVEVWLSFCKKYNLDPNSQPSFSEFLNILESDENKHFFDIHFRPQYLLNNVDFIKPRFIGRFERMNEIANFLKESGISFIDYRPHAKSSKKIALTKEHVRKIQKIYEFDFSYYQYDPDPDSNHIPSSTYQTQELSKDFISFSKMRGRYDVRKIAMSAIHVAKSGAVLTAMILMRRALMLQPDNLGLASIVQQTENNSNFEDQNVDKHEAEADRILELIK